jgi:glycosyltransferase involved in cell wall biosynthesis
MNNNNISIIVPTFKRNNYLFKIINILNKQLSTNFLFEIIIIDSRLNNFFKYMKFKNTRYFNIIENSNALKRNIGITKARFKNIIFLDDDCLPSNTFLNDYYNLFKNSKKNIICGSVTYDKNDINKNNYLIFRSRGHFIINKKQNLHDKILSPSNIVTMNMGIKLNYLFKPFFRKEFKNYGFEDYEFGFRYIKSGYKIVASYPLVTHKENRNYNSYLNKFYFLGNKGCKIFSNINFLAYKSSNYYKLENMLLIFKKNKIFKLFVNMLFRSSIFLFNFKAFRNKYLFKFNLILAFTLGVLDRCNDEYKQLVWY